MSEPPAPDLLARLSDVDVGYRRTPVATGIDVAIERGTYWALLGPNGRGKTTLIHTLLGTLRPLRGTITFGPECNRRRDLAFVPQSCQQLPSLPTTVREFVSLGLVHLRVPRREREQRLRQALEQVHLADRVDGDFWHLSGGQRQRALIARALIRRPALLILDEPATGLDIAAEQALLGCLAELHARGLTIMLITHDLAMARRHATHAMLFHAQRVTAGTADELLTSRPLAEAFGISIEQAEACL